MLVAVTSASTYSEWRQAKMEMFREIPSSSEARQVLSEEEMNRLLQKKETVWTAFILKV